MTTAPLGKPVGVAATADTLFVADQDARAIFAIRSGAMTELATGLPAVDLLTLLPDGGLVTGGKTGAVYRIAVDGKVTVVASGFEQIRGTAYDPARKRLFAVEHSTATSTHKLHLLPFEL
jgi:hypothetical protein